MYFLDHCAIEPKTSSSSAAPTAGITAQIPTTIHLIEV
jgi:hypothetical protein